MDASPPEHTVILRHAEVMEAGMAARGGLLMASTLFALALFVAIALAIEAGTLAAFYGVQHVPFEVMFAVAPYITTVVPALFVFVAVKLMLDWQRGVMGKAYLARMKSLGIPLERAATYRVLDEGLQLATERVDILTRWPAIDSVEKGRLGWVVSADQLTLLIPFASFADEDAQRAFMAAIVGCMGAEDRGRSREAVDFAENAAPPPELPLDGLPAESPSGDAAVSSTDMSVPEGHGWLTMEQANWAAGVMYQRLAKSRFHAVAYPLLATVVGFSVGLFLASMLVTFIMPGLQRLHEGLYAALAFGAPLLGACIGNFLGQRRVAIVAAKAWRAELEKRGVPEQIEASYALAETGLVYRTARFTGEAAYPSIHEVHRVAPYWIVAADTLTLAIADDAFGDPEKAKRFIRALLSRLDEPARERSVDLPD